MSFNQVVVNNYFMAVLHQFFGDDAADITGAAGNKHTHAINLQQDTIKALFLKSVFYF
jgi:hypothetical protein